MTFLLFVSSRDVIVVYILCESFIWAASCPRIRCFVAIGHCWIGVALGMITIMSRDNGGLLVLIDPAMALVRLYVVHHLHLAVLGICLGLRSARWGRRQIYYYLFQSGFSCRSSGWRCGKGYAGVALALVTIQLEALAVVTAFVGYNTTDFAILQLPMLVLSITGLLRNRYHGAPRRRHCACANKRRGVGADAVQCPGKLAR